MAPCCSASWPGIWHGSVGNLYLYFVFNQMDNSHLLKSTESMNKVVKSEDDIHVATDGQVGQERTKIAKAGDLLHWFGLLGEQPGSRF